LFYLDDPNADRQMIPAGSVYDLSTLPDGKTWALILGDHAWSGGSFSESPVPGFALVRRDNPTVTVDFRSGAWPGVISHVQGLSAPESDGTWSNSDIVTIEFAIDLPEHFQLHITAAAFGPNAGMDFVARVGTNTAPFTLDTTLQERVLDFRNPARVRTLEIEVPLPTSPNQLGLNADTRRLGIRLATLQIAPLP
jgi:phosphoglycerol transferase